MNLNDKIVERLFRYVKFYTTSDPEADTIPSSERQRDFANLLAEELEEIGVKFVRVDSKAFVMAKIPANTNKKIETVGFIAHMDTAPDAPGENVNPQLHEKYDGKVIKINDKLSISPSNAPDLALYKGHDIITSDGTTLLGGDDKAGIAAIMTAAEYIINHPEMDHGDIAIAFTPDEEIGEGGNYFDVDAFGADFAYTVDGETLGEFNCETFNAAEVTVKITGHNVHPGSAKGKMINACDVACELATMLPAKERPEYTEGYEGFYHLTDMKGDVSYAEMTYILRDFYKNKLEDRKRRFQMIVDNVNDIFGPGTVVIEIKDEYSNMKEAFEGKEYIIDYAKTAYERCGVNFEMKPIRGGTDGSKLSFRGLPTPNIFTGGGNLHSLSEYLSCQAMEKASNVIVKIVEEVAK